MPRVDFYILEDPSEAARLNLVCRLAEKIWSQAHTVCIAAGSKEEAQRLDDLLWTYRDGSFVPHELAMPGVKASKEMPILIAVEPLPEAGCDVLINLQERVPESFARFERIAEPVNADPERRKAGRERFKLYRERGCALESHAMPGAYEN